MILYLQAKLVDFTSSFSPCNFEKSDSIILNETDKANLTDQTKFRLNEISKIENYFNSEINQKKSCSKKLSKYVATFDYIDKF